MESQTDISIPDELLRRYKDFRKLGAGAMGAVYKAHDSNLDIDVAIKLLKQRQIAPEVAIRFQQEAKVASKLKHPNLVTLMDFGISEKGEPYIIMENVEGDSLASILEVHGAMPLIPALNILTQVCNGMEHAHRSGIVHRDLKPSNVIVCGDDLSTATIKVLDFGIAKLDDTNGSITRTGTILGTPYYMSPEQFSGENVDRRTDIYSAGSMLFRMLTDCHPFEGDTMLEIMTEKRSKDAPLMTDVATEVDIPEDIEDVVAKCLAQDPDERYQTMSEFKEALLDSIERHNALLAQTQSAEMPHLNLKPTGKSIPKSVYAIAVLLLGALCTLGWLATRALNPPQEPLVPKKESALANFSLESAPAAGAYETPFAPNFSTGCWKALGPVTDNDIKILYQNHREQIRELLLGDINELSSKNTLTSRGWALIGKLPLVKLGAPYNDIKTENMKSIAKISSLEVLAIPKTPLTDAGLKYLENKSTLQEIDVTDTKITDEGLKSIATLKHLKRLSLSENNITTRGLEHISVMRGLKMLAIPATKVTDSDMKYVALLTKLETLTLNYTSVSHEGLRQLKSLTNLRDLNLEGCKNIDDKCIELIAQQWPNLELLNLDHTSVTARSLKTIAAKLKNVRSLGLVGLGLTDNDLMPIYTIPMITRVRLLLNSISDKTLDNIGKKRSIRYVEVHHCPKITGSGVSRLKALHVNVLGLDQKGAESAEAMEMLKDFPAAP